MTEGLVFAPSKVDIQHRKIEQYLNGESIYPTTIELDLTQLCTRSCSGCPYSSARKAGLTLELPFLDRLFSILGPHTPGIVFSGGESTIVPHFPEALALARRKGFEEVAVISNGANIDVPEVQDALMENATSIRVSMYDWQARESKHFIKTLKKIESLRERIEETGSRLEIGASMLTRSDLNHRYTDIGLQVINSGIHWLYFHPYCVDWDQQYPTKADQTGVLEAIEELRVAAPDDANIQVPLERYSDGLLHFDKLHGAHFLIEVGADGVNYAGPECKYEPEARLLDLTESMEEDFLWHPDRIARLNELTSDNYRFIGTKHRPPMFSDYIQKIIDIRTLGRGGDMSGERADRFAYPSII